MVEEEVSQDVEQKDPPSKVLWSALRSNGFPLEYDAFISEMSDENNRATLYNKVKAKGIFTKTSKEFDDFFVDVTPSKKKESTQQLPAYTNVSTPVAQPSTTPVSDGSTDFLSQHPEIQQTISSTPKVNNDPYNPIIPPTEYKSVMDNTKPISIAEVANTNPQQQRLSFDNKATKERITKAAAQPLSVETNAKILGSTPTVANADLINHLFNDKPASSFDADFINQNFSNLSEPYQKDIARYLSKLSLENKNQWTNLTSRVGSAGMDEKQKVELLEKATGDRFMQAKKDLDILEARQFEKHFTGKGIDTNIDHADEVVNNYNAAKTDAIDLVKQYPSVLKERKEVKSKYEDLEINGDDGIYDKTKKLIAGQVLYPVWNAIPDLVKSTISIGKGASDFVKNAAGVDVNNYGESDRLMDGLSGFLDNIKGVTPKTFANENDYKGEDKDLFSLGGFAPKLASTVAQMYMFGVAGKTAKGYSSIASSIFGTMQQYDQYAETAKELGLKDNEQFMYAAPMALVQSMLENVSTLGEKALAKARTQGMEEAAKFLKDNPKGDLQTHLLKFFGEQYAEEFTQLGAEKITNMGANYLLGQDKFDTGVSKKEFAETAGLTTALNFLLKGKVGKEFQKSYKTSVELFQANKEGSTQYINDLYRNNDITRQQAQSMQDIVDDGGKAKIIQDYETKTAKLEENDSKVAAEDTKQESKPSATPQIPEDKRVKEVSEEELLNENKKDENKKIENSDSGLIANTTQSANENRIRENEKVPVNETVTKNDFTIPIQKNDTIDEKTKKSETQKGISDNRNTNDPIGEMVFGEQKSGIRNNNQPVLASGIEKIDNGNVGKIETINEKADKPIEPVNQTEQSDKASVSGDIAINSPVKTEVDDRQASRADIGNNVGETKEQRTERVNNTAKDLSPKERKAALGVINETKDAALLDVLTKEEKANAPAAITEIYKQDKANTPVVAKMKTTKEQKIKISDTQGAVIVPSAKGFEVAIVEKNDKGKGVVVEDKIFKTEKEAVDYVESKKGKQPTDNEERMGNWEQDFNKPNDKYFMSDDVINHLGQEVKVGDKANGGDGKISKIEDVDIGLKRDTYLSETTNSDGSKSYRVYDKRTGLPIIGENQKTRKKAVELAQEKVKSVGGKAGELIQYAEENIVKNGEKLYGKKTANNYSTPEAKLEIENESLANLVNSKKLSDKDKLGVLYGMGIDESNAARIAFDNDKERLDNIGVSIVEEYTKNRDTLNAKTIEQRDKKTQEEQKTHLTKIEEDVKASAKKKGIDNDVVDKSVKEVSENQKIDEKDLLDLIHHTNGNADIVFSEYDDLQENEDLNNFVLGNKLFDLTEDTKGYRLTEKGKQIINAFNARSEYLQLEKKGQGNLFSKSDNNTEGGSSSESVKQGSGDGEGGGGVKSGNDTSRNNRKELEKESDSRRDKLANDINKNESNDAHKVFKENGFSLIDGVYIHKSISEWYNKLPIKLKEAIVKSKITFLTSAVSSKQIEDRTAVTHGMYAKIDYKNGGAAKGVYVDISNAKAQDVLLHEIGHHIFQTQLNFRQKSIVSHAPIVTTHAKEVDIRTNTRSDDNHYSQKGIQEENFAELFFENNGDIDKTLKLLNESLKNKEVVLYKYNERTRQYEKNKNFKITDLINSLSRELPIAGRDFSMNGDTYIWNNPNETPFIKNGDVKKPITNESAISPIPLSDKTLAKVIADNGDFEGEDVKGATYFGNGWWKINDDNADKISLYSPTKKQGYSFFNTDRGNSNSFIETAEKFRDLNDDRTDTQFEKDLINESDKQLDEGKGNGLTLQQHKIAAEISIVEKQIEGAKKGTNQDRVKILEKKKAELETRMEIAKSLDTPTFAPNTPTEVNESDVDKSFTPEAKEDFVTAQKTAFENEKAKLLKEWNQAKGDEIFGAGLPLNPKQVEVAFKMAVLHIKAGYNSLTHFVSNFGLTNIKDKIKSIYESARRLVDFQNGIGIRQYLNTFGESVADYVDSDYAIKRMQKDLKKAGLDIDDKINVAEMRELATSKVEYKRKTVNDWFKKSIEDLKKQGIKYEDFRNFAYALHAPSRNARVLELTEQNRANELKPLQKELDKLQDDYINATTKAERNDLTARINKKIAKMDEITNRPQVVEGSGMSDATAAKILADARAAGTYDTLEKSAQDFQDNVIKPRIDEMEESGLITPEAAQALRDGTRDGFTSKLEHYIPLVVDPAHLENGEFVSDISGLGSGVKGLTGTDKYGVDMRRDPITTAVLQYNALLKTAEQNRIGNALLNLVRSSPFSDNFLIVKQAKIPVMGTDGSLQGVEDYTKANDPISKVPIKEHSIFVKENGKGVYVFVRPMKGDDGKFVKGRDGGVKPHPLVEMWHHQPEQASKIVKAIVAVSRTINRAQRALITTYNIGFAFRNIFRDVREAFSNLPDIASTEGMKKLKRSTLTNLPLVTAYLVTPKGKLRESNETFRNIGKALDELKMNGGMISFSNFEGAEKELAKLQTQIAKIYGTRTSGDKAKEIANKTLDTMALTGEVSETITRLSVYMAMREQGASAQKSAYVTKNITLNFEKKGRKGGIINSLYLFLNPGIQGANRFVQAAQTKKFWTYFAGVTALAALNRAALYAGADDDDKLDDWIYDDLANESNTLVFNPFDRHNPIRIPKPYSGIRMAYSIGEGAIDVFQGKKTGHDVAFKTIGDLYSSLNPLGGGGKAWTSFVPTEPLKSAAELEINKNWAGQDIYKGKLKGNDLDYGKENYNTPQLYIDTAKKMYDAIGVNVAPTTYEYVANKVMATGGITELLYPLMKGIGDSPTSDYILGEQQVNKINNKPPIIGDFYTDAQKDPNKVIVNAYQIAKKSKEYEKASAGEIKYLEKAIERIKAGGLLTGYGLTDLKNSLQGLKDPNFQKELDKKELDRERQKTNQKRESKGLKDLIN